MPFQFGPDVSCCEYDGHFIFLDTRKDQYFRLSTTLERALARYIETGDETGVLPLVDKGLLECDPTNSHPPRPPRVAAPVRSAMEQTFSTERPSAATHLEVLGIVCRTHWQLATRNLSDVLGGLSTYRNRKAPPPPSSAARADVERFFQMAREFNLARVYVPIVPRCLPDAIAMARFLARRGLHADVVFGVAGNPFAAHAWVQAGDLVLSDSVGNVAAHTPIRVV